MSGPVGSAVPVVQGVPLDRYSAGRGRQAVQTSLGTQSIYSLPEGVRKRDVRGLARLGSLAAAAVLALNIVTFHVALTIAWAGTVLLFISALANMVAAFADELSFRSFVASMTDFALAMGAGFSFLLQAGAAELESRALSLGLQMISFIIEAAVIGLTVGTSLFGAATEVDKRD